MPLVNGSASSATPDLNHQPKSSGINCSILYPVLLLNLTFWRLIHMTEVKHAGGIVSSSKVPALHLIPTEALICLAERFEVGTERKGEGAWNALTKNQQCLDDKAFLIERCSHIIRHTMLLRDQLAHGYSPEQEDSPYENAGAIIFGGALMACAVKRAEEKSSVVCEGKGAECVICGCHVASGIPACNACIDHVKERTDPVEAFESPDDWVVQDRVPARHNDRGAWVDIGEEYPPYDFSSRHWWTVGDKADQKLKHGTIDAVGRTLHLICRRRDLPELSVPDEEEWVDLNQYPDHVLREGIDWVRCGSPLWVKVCIIAGSPIRDLNGEFRCLKKDLPLSLVPEPPAETIQSLYPPHADASFMCRNHGVVSGLEFNPAQKMWFWKNRSDVCWDLYGKARRISLDLTDEELRGFDIVNKIHMHPHEE